MSNGRYPLPNRVAEYGSGEEFSRCRVQDGQWVFWEDRVELVLAGRYDEVRPLHVELSPTYLCNFACPWCSCRTAREEWSEEDVFHHPKATDLTVASEARLLKILHHLSEDRVGIMWVGGEPTMHPGLYRAGKLADSLGLQQCLFTNGSLLDENRLRCLLEANFIFIRFSLDAVSPLIHEAFHDYAASRRYSDMVKTNVDIALRIRGELGARTLIGISVVVDSRNYADLIPTITFVANLSENHGRGIDYIIIRPAYQFYKSQIELEPGMGQQLAAALRSDGDIDRRLKAAGVKLIAPEASFYSPETQMRPKLKGPCRACGWFSEVSPSGAMLLCSDRYGNPDFVIGDIAATPLSEIWRAERRRATLQMTERKSCMATQCPANGRGFHLNSLFAQIEDFRERDQLDQVRGWIDALRRTIPRPAHPFFL